MLRQDNRRCLHCGLMRGKGVNQIGGRHAEEQSLAPLSSHTRVL